ncbi:MAG: hypothetical protein K2I18_03495 [Paramuribaculum sp.]|nr:hypothetical protein [Paramuribaculum sp.]
MKKYLLKFFSLFFVTSSCLLFSCKYDNSGEAHREFIERNGPAFGVQGWNYIISHDNYKDWRLDTRTHSPKCRAIKDIDFSDFAGISLDIFGLYKGNQTEQIWLFYKDGVPVLQLTQEELSSMSKEELLGLLYTAWGDHLKAYQLSDRAKLNRRFNNLMGF